MWVVSAITISPDVSGRKLGPRGGVSKVQGLGKIPHCWNCKTEDFVYQPGGFDNFFKTMITMVTLGRGESRESCVVRGVKLLQPFVGQTLAFLL